MNDYTADGYQVFTPADTFATGSGPSLPDPRYQMLEGQNSQSEHLPLFSPLYLGFGTLDCLIVFDLFSLSLQMWKFLKKCSEVSVKKKRTFS